MSKTPKDDQYDDDEVKRRAEQALRGAFKTPPIEKKKVPPAPPLSKRDGADEGH